MAYPITTNVKFRTLKSTGVDNVEVSVLKEVKTAFDRADHKVEAIVDFPATIADLKSGGDGSVINGVPVINKTGFAPVFGRIKRNFPVWKYGVNSPEWNYVKNYGEYFLESKPE